ncbi:MAG: methyltransferase family protein [Gammaproteobacteria bacterium]
MGHRTKELAPLSGLPGMIREARYHEFSRQALGIVLVPVFGWFCAPLPLLFYIGAAVALLGIVVRLYASGFIVKNHELATVGPYAVVRHPLYTGNVLILLGMVLGNSQWWAAVLGVWFLWFFYPTTIEYEDRKLRKIFGEKWDAWSADVPAIFPRSLSGMGGGSWSFMKSLRQNAEPLVVLWVLFWLYWLWRQLPGEF